MFECVLCLEGLTVSSALDRRVFGIQTPKQWAKGLCGEVLRLSSNGITRKRSRRDLQAQARTICTIRKRHSARLGGMATRQFGTILLIKSRISLRTAYQMPWAGLIGNHPPYPHKMSWFIAPMLGDPRSKNRAWAFSRNASHKRDPCSRYSGPAESGPPRGHGFENLSTIFLPTAILLRMYICIYIYTSGRRYSRYSTCSA